MAKQRKIGAIIALDGEREFKTAVTSCNKSLATMKSEMKLVSAQTTGSANTLEALRKKHDVLQRTLDEQAKKEEAVRKGLEHAQEDYNRVGSELEQYKTKLSKAQETLKKMEESQDTTKEAMAEQQKVVSELAKHSEKYSILEYDIGDTVTLLDDLTDTREEQRIVGMKIYPDAPEKNSCTLANKVLTFDELAQKYEDTANTVDNITNDNGQIDGDTIDGIYSRQIIDLEDGIVNSVYIKNLDAQYVQVSGKLTAVEGEFGTLKANVAEFEETYTKRLTAAEADIGKLRTTDLSAVNGRINILDSNYANIKNLLSGSAGIGDLQNIHLTSDNAVIDTALVRTAVMQSVTIGDLLAGTISTNKFKIMSDDGGIQISGATQQWKDANGVVRMQAGRDAKGTTNDATSSPVKVTIKLNSGVAESVTVGSDGNFSKALTLVAGTNTITVVATDSAGKTTTVTRTVKLDTSAPVIKSVTLNPNPVDAGKTFIISVEVVD